MASRSIAATLVRAGAPISDALPRAWAARPRPNHNYSSQQCRCFSVSVARQAQHAVTFNNTSSTELDDILARIHRLIILPSYLPKDQQKKLYNPKHDMRVDPITLELDGEVIRFQHIDMFKDLPDSRTILRDAVKLMRTRGDWSNLPKLLEGMNGAQRKLRRSDKTKITSMAGHNGEIYQVIEAARAVQRTGFSLKYPNVTTELLLQIQLKAIESGYAEESTKRALLWSEMVIALLEDDAHRYKTPHLARKDKETVILHREPHILAARLHLAAAVAAKRADKQDVDGKVAKYANVLAALWPAGTKLADLRPPIVYGVDHRNDNRNPILPSANRRLAIVAPIVKGLRLSVEVLTNSEQQELADKMTAMLPALEEEMAECRATAVEGGAVVGPSIYRKLFEQPPAETEANV